MEIFKSAVFTLVVLNVFINCYPENLHMSIEEEQSENCTCVPYYQCSEDSGNIITDGDGLLDHRYNDQTQCTGYFDVCCNTIRDQPISTETPAINKGCGYLKHMTVPWSGVLLTLNAENTWEHKCGVSVIHQKVVLTAAHCLDSSQDHQRYLVRISKYSWNVEKIIVHPNFNYGTLQNDLALVLLDKPMNIENICIPPPGLQLETKDMNRCIVTTWKSNKLAVLELPLVDKSRCEHLLRNTRLGKFFNLHSTFLCAGGDNEKDTCEGDGGSPLICPVPGQPGRFHQVGVVSWGIGCGENNTPGVYVNVGKFRDWIDESLLANSLEITSYRY